MPLKATADQRKRRRLARIDLSPLWNSFQALSSKPWRDIAEALRRIQAAFDALYVEEPQDIQLQPRRIIANFCFPADFEVGTDVTPRVEFALRLNPGETARPIQAFINATTVPNGGDLVLDCYYSTDPFDTIPASRTWTPLFPDLTAAEVTAALLPTNYYKLILPEGQEIREFPVVLFRNPTDPATVVPDLPFSALLRCDVLEANSASIGVAKIVFEVRPATEARPVIGVT